MYQKIKQTVAGANICNAMGRETIKKSRVSLKNGRNRGNLMKCAVFLISMAMLGLSACSENSPKNITNSIFEQLNKGNYKEALSIFEENSYVLMGSKSYLNPSDMATIFKYEQRREYKIDEIIKHDNYHDDSPAIYDRTKVIEIKYSYVSGDYTKSGSFLFIKISGKWGIKGKLDSLL